MFYLRFCQKPTFNGQGCSSIIFNTNGIAYQKVCGGAGEYQNCYAVYPPRFTFSGSMLDTSYVDGLSITYGNPQQHIWTYSAGEYDKSGIN